MFVLKKKLILASASRIRAEILSSCGFEFEVCPAEINEEELKQTIRGKSHVEFCERLSIAKAENVSKKNCGVVVLGADQLCVCEDKIYSKPGNKERALEQLRELQGKQHRLISAAALSIEGETIWHGSEIAEMKMRTLSANAISKYVTEVQPFHSCGSCQYEQTGKLFFEKTTGSFECILGLPFHSLITALLENDILEF